MRCHRFRIFDFIWGPSQEHSSGAGALGNRSEQTDEQH